MTRFVGGPYDGMECYVDPTFVSSVRLPPKEKYREFLSDPRMTKGQKWPHFYEADLTEHPPVYRFVKTDEQA